MSNELAHIENNTTPATSDDGLELLVKQAKAMDAAHQLATALCNTSMVPTTFRGKPDDGAAAILYGAELGLKPQQALQQVFVIHGQPAIYARTMAGLLKAKGYRFQTVEDTPQAVTVHGVSPRGEEETSTWTIERAKTAGYTGNKKYQSDPQAMLYAKALSEVCRKLAPDVLLGIKYTAEDLQLEPIKMTATRTDTRGVDRVREALAQKQQQAPREETPALPEPSPALIEFTNKVADGESYEVLKGIAEDAQTVLNGSEYEELKNALNQRYAALKEGDK